MNLTTPVKCPACEEPTLTEHCDPKDHGNANCRWWKCVNPKCQAAFDAIEGRGHTLIGGTKDWRGNTVRVYLDRDERGVWHDRYAA